MARILFVLSSDQGHLNLCIGPASYLQSEGHTVAFYAVKNLTDQLNRADFQEVFFVDDVPPVRLDAARSSRLAANLRNREWSRLWLRSLMLDELDWRVQKLRDVVRKEFKPDVMVVMSTVYEGAIVAASSGIPWVGVTAGMSPFIPDGITSELREHCAVLAREREEALRQYGHEFTFLMSDLLSPHLNLAFTTNDVHSHRSNADFKRIGPSIPPRDRGDETDMPWDRINDRVPLVYLSFGNETYNRTDALSIVFEAVSDEKIQLICSAGTLVEEAQSLPEFSSIPDNVLLVSYAPQLTVLAGSSAFITHGGGVSVMESIYFGVPMLVSPLWFDHAHQAYFIEKEGLGVRCDIDRASPAVLWKHLDGLLKTKKIKDAVEKLQLSYKRNEGAFEAARLIANLSERARV